jgi:hypothetical protein
MNLIPAIHIAKIKTLPDMIQCGHTAKLVGGESRIKVYLISHQGIGAHFPLSPQQIINRPNFIHLDFCAFF